MTAGGGGWLTWASVALGGAAGACLRYLVDRAVRARHESVFPWGTLTVNAAGSALLGTVTGAAWAGAAGPGAVALLGTGLCGALTTYSAFSYETLRLAERGRARAALANAVLTPAVALGSLWAGLALVRYLAG
ncbi:fluoride efflux transporter CrcB [Streptomyces sp. TRM 70361]|uniref:fluoride efflux transporter CrcB n=1 Tax=Streptomyces sp. TRM 70361 TaxID=3116553 RepID=UPI002E7AC2F5|nr:fluoride efflux transporter CrcB [Streptomyces sp. TRM 70361]MEE1941674.1 fluoride efflux transporter CrcB [Streptomyces sp. TRM 70361]